MATRTVYTIIFALILTSSCYAQSSLYDQLKLIANKESHYNILVDSIASIEQKILTDKSPDAKIDQKLRILKTQKREVYREMVEIKAAIYDAEQAEPIWAEGTGEILLDDKKPYEQSKRLALMYARRDAMEKGGKLILESMTRLERFEETSEENGNIKNEYWEEFKSIIQSKGKVKVIDQDQSGEYNKVLTLKENGLTKLQVTVRLKMTSINEFNPFREELKQLNN